MTKIEYNRLINSTDNITDDQINANQASVRLNKFSFLKSKKDELVNSWSSIKKESKYDLDLEDVLKNYHRKKPNG